VALMLTGQHIPNADIALYSRLIFLSFSKVEFRDHEKTAFLKLKTIEQLGLTHITHEILSFRKDFIKNFADSYDIVQSDILKEIKNVVIEDRIFRNWLLILASYHSLQNLISVPWTYKDLITKASLLIINQNSEIKRTNELAKFWTTIEFLVNEGELKDQVDFRVEMASELYTDKVNVAKGDWPAGKLLLFLNHSRALPKYRIHGRKTGESVLPLNTLEYYLMNSFDYMGKKQSMSFKVEKDKKVVADVEVDDINSGKKTIITRRITKAMTFDYLNLNIDIITEVGEEKGNLPF
jgi:DNA primase